jgi:hypothetical protein
MSEFCEEMGSDYCHSHFHEIGGEAYVRQEFWHDFGAWLERKGILTPHQSELLARWVDELYGVARKTFASR